MNPTDLALLLREGHSNAAPASWLAKQLGCSEREVGKAAAALIEDGLLVGTRCDDEPGYFLIRDFEDLDIGTAHMRKRAASIFARLRKVQALAEEQIGFSTARLFELEEV